MKTKPQNKKRALRVGLLLIIVLMILSGIGIVVYSLLNFSIIPDMIAADYNEKCLKVSVSVIDSNCGDPSACSLVLERRGMLTGNISGVFLVFRDEATAASSKVISVEGNIKPLSPKTAVVNTGMNEFDKVESIVYFMDKEGTRKACSQKIVYKF